MDKKKLIKEAENRGYKSGILIDYEARLTGTDTLGDGEFDMKNGNLIKYENKNTNSSFRRFDTLWSKENGWVKIVKEKYGFAL